MKTSIGTPIFIIVVGLGWLLNSLNLIPRVDWLWTLGLGALGCVTLIGGLNRWNVVVGPMLLLSSAFSFFRQVGMLKVEVELPLLTIAFGCLLLFSQQSHLPTPEWMKEGVGAEKGAK